MPELVVPAPPEYRFKRGSDPQVQMPDTGSMWVLRGGHGEAFHINRYCTYLRRQEKRPARYRRFVTQVRVAAVLFAARHPCQHCIVAGGGPR